VNQIEQEVWQTVQAMNKAWAEDGDAEKLNDYFHKDMVAITPTDRNRLEGREACVAGWKAFVQATKIHYWKVLDPKVELFGENKFAIVTYYFDMSFDMGGQTITIGGRDMFALVNENGKWWIVADQFSPYPH
jgi:uncharacterized protein (TIGR02246 family)